MYEQRVQAFECELYREQSTITINSYTNGAQNCYTKMNIIIPENIHFHPKKRALIERIHSIEKDKNRINIDIHNHKDNNNNNNDRKNENYKNIENDGNDKNNDKNRIQRKLDENLSNKKKKKIDKKKKKFATDHKIVLKKDEIGIDVHVISIGKTSANCLKVTYVHTYWMNLIR